MKRGTAVVTGASAGIGRACARKLAALGARVVLGARRLDRLLSLTRELGPPAIALATDVTDRAQVQRLVDAAVETHGRIDVLVNCAGITRFVPHNDLEALDDQLIDDIFRVNWRGAFAAVRAFRPLLAAGGNGLVINISSIAGVTAMGSNVAYCASKAALDSMTLSLARALAPQIRVVSVSPGWVEGEYARRMRPELIEEQRRKTPLGRIAQAQDVANAVVAAATLLTFTTGAIIPVDGGRPLT